MFCQEGRHEKWDIHFSLAQWGHLYWKHVKTVIEVSSKCPLVDGVFQITIGSCDESGVDWLGFRGTQRTDFMLLNYEEASLATLSGALRFHPRREFQYLRLQPALSCLYPLP